MVLPVNKEKVMKSIAEDQPAYYLVKSDWNLEQVVEKIKNGFHGLLRFGK